MSRKVLLTLPWLAQLALSTACSTSEDVPRAVGQLESDRVEISADVAEPIDTILVREGQAVVTGDPLLDQNRARIDARTAETQAALAQSQARLDELTRGPRKELVAAARANVEGARRELEFRSIEPARATSVFERQLAARETVDQAQAALDAAQANLASLKARLDELLEGTTVEELRQAESAIDRIEAQLALMHIDAARHRSLAPVDGIVDSILFEPGERPAVGQPMLILLTGEQPYARIWVPGSVRVGIAPGTTAQVFVDGLAEPLGVQRGSVYPLLRAHRA